MVRTRRSVKAKESAKCSCNVCGQPDNEQMVQCDCCNEWFHFTCVNVSEEISESDWACDVCRESGATGAVGKEQESTATDIETFYSPTGVSMNGRPQDHHSKAASEVGGRLSPNNSVLNKNILSQNVRFELMRLEEEKEIKMIYIEKKYAILQKYESDAFVDNDNVNVDAAVAPQDVQDAHYGNRALKLTNVNAAVISDGLCYIQNNNRKGFMAENRVDEGNEVGDDSKGMRAVNKVEGAAQSLDTTPAFRVSDTHINARHVVPKELPVFSGHPEEWPVFISSFENSTRLCGFSNDENLLRLQRSLKGKAREYVSCQLMLPELVPKIISTLRMIFGRPEHIINSLILKLRGVPCVNQSKLDTLVNFALEVQNLTSTILAADLQNHLNNPVLIQELLEKLPATLSLQWAMHKRNIKGENLLAFSEWLYDLAESASSIISMSVSKQRDSDVRKTQRLNFHEEPANACPATRTSLKCYFCEEDHPILKCEKFKRLDYKQKWDEIFKKKLCRSCLKKHDFRSCRQLKECGVNGCSVRHHPILHKQESTQTSEATDRVVAVHHIKTSGTLFRILPITIYEKFKSLNVYAFLDDGSGPTLIEQSVLDDLQIEGRKKELCLCWTDGTVHKEMESRLVDLKVSQPGKQDKVLSLVDVHSVKRLDLPAQTMQLDELTNKYKHLRGLPLKSYSKVTPKIIIGLNNRNVAMPLKFREGKAHEPAATKTRLGWTIYGVVRQSALNHPNNGEIHQQMHICECNDDVALQTLMLENMKIESEPKGFESTISMLDKEFQGKVTRDGDHFIAKLLWNPSDVKMSNNYSMAARRLNCFEKKLANDQELKIRVNEHIIQMEKKGYIRKLSSNEISIERPRTWYLPMFAVKNPNKPSKLRVVWDAAAKHDGVSLNDCLSKGPDLLVSLPKVLFNFRIGKVGICGDICDMFHRVAVDKDDQHAQRFLWRNCNEHQEPEVYVLQVLSFGASCSPSLAQYAKIKNAKEFEGQYPRAVKSIIERHYVDDMLDSVNTEAEAIQLATGVRSVHAKGGFHIRNWLSNSSKVLEVLDDDGAVEEFCKAGRTVEQIFEAEKILGMWWNTKDDYFTYRLKYTKACEDIMRAIRTPTKRELLRLLMSIFDPLGLLSYFTIYMKILMQNVWRSHIDWDQAIPEEFVAAWHRWLSNLKYVEDVKIPRCYFTLGSNIDSKIQLHIFVDASEHAYAAVAYFRIESPMGIAVSLVCAKTKVAPLRPISIPRMELLAAVLGARLANTVVQSHDLVCESTHYWSDSNTVLLWLGSDARAYKQFVKFRIAEIQESPDIKNWKYISTKLNVADLATKWSRAPDPVIESRWFNGPLFLKSVPSEWPTDNADVRECNNDQQEEAAINQHSAMFERHEIVDVFRFSKWERLLRTMAYVKLVVEKLKAAKYTEKGASLPILSMDTLCWSEEFLCRVAQNSVYHKEIQLLKDNQRCVIPKESPLRKLSPFIDESSVIRMRSRLEKSTNIANATKNPIILPKQHRITHLTFNL